jgi:NADH-quinone oxidoreductase subunit A
MQFYEEYSPLILFFFISIFLSFLIIVLSYTFSQSFPDIEKLSSYECGFDSFEDARHTFQVHFYLIGILFIIFDLELMFLFPGILVLAYLTYFGVSVLSFFLLVLTLGYAYEWFKGALNW